MRLALLVNPKSGRGSDPEELLAELRSHGVDAQVFTLDEHDGVRGAAPDRLVVAGGDGSIGLAAALASELAIPLAVVATGTANDFARAHALPRELSPALELAALGTHLAPIELGHMHAEGQSPHGRPFVNVASAGLAADAAREAADLKARWGTIAYLIGAAQAGATSDRLDSRVVADGEVVFEGPAWQIITASSGAFGAGSTIERARPDDGRLDVVVVPGEARAALPLRAMGLRSGRIADQRGVVHAVADRIQVEVPSGTAYNVDGELCVAGPAEFTCRPDAFQLVVPAPDEE